MEIKLISLIWGQDKINVNHVKVKLLQFYKHCWSKNSQYLFKHSFPNYLKLIGKHVSKILSNIKTRLEIWFIFSKSGTTDSCFSDGDQVQQIYW